MYMRSQYPVSPLLQAAGGGNPGWVITAPVLVCATAAAQVCLRSQPQGMDDYNILAGFNERRGARSDLCQLVSYSERF